MEERRSFIFIVDLGQILSIGLLRTLRIIQLVILCRENAMYVLGMLHALLNVVQPRLPIVHGKLLDIGFDFWTA